MDLNLAPEVEAIIDAHVRSGLYPDRSAVVAAAVMGLAGSGDFAPGEWDALLAEAERSGPPVDAEAAFARVLSRTREGAAI